MTIAVDMGRKANKQTNKQDPDEKCSVSAESELLNTNDNI